MNIPPLLQYTAEHLWIKQAGDGCWIAGITDYAQDLLGDIVYLEPPKVNDELTSGQPCGIVESVKTGSDLHAPMNGIVTEINEDLLSMPEGINDKPYDAWIFKFQTNQLSDTDDFLSAEAYKALISDT